MSTQDALSKYWAPLVESGVEATKPLHSWLAQHQINVDPEHLFLLALAGTILLITVTTILLFCRGSGKKKATKGNALLIWGPTGAGKTCIFYRLRENAFPATITSLAPNEDKLTVGNKRMTVIDYPGHQRLKTEMLQSYLRKAGALLFVLDASNLKSDIARTAQQLYDILTQSYVSEAAVPVIVACNKSDDVQAANANQSKQMLLVELERLRSTRAASSALVAEADDRDTVQIGVIGRPFKFEDLEHDIQFVSCSAFKGDLDSLKDALAGI